MEDDDNDNDDPTEYKLTAPAESPTATVWFKSFGQKQVMGGACSCCVVVILAVLLRLVVETWDCSTVVDDPVAVDDVVSNDPVVGSRSVAKVTRVHAGARGVTARLLLERTVGYSFCVVVVVLLEVSPWFPLSSRCKVSRTCTGKSAWT